jgi:hypothetical protein
MISGSLKKLGKFKKFLYSNANETITCQHLRDTAKAVDAKQKVCSHECLHQKIEEVSNEQLNTLQAIRKTIANQFNIQ